MLITAITSIQDALKNSDWRTQKAASEALAELLQAMDHILFLSSHLHPFP